jgi:hypothetical protein
MNSKKVGALFRPNLKAPDQVRGNVLHTASAVGLTVWRTIGYIAEVTEREIDISRVRARDLALGGCSLSLQYGRSLGHVGWVDIHALAIQ